MAKYLRKFETTAEYESAQSGLILPNVSYITEGNDVEYNPYVPQRNDIITYEASAKLAETTSDKNSGLHTNAFNTTIKSHTFENGVGTIEFNDDVTSVGNYAFFQCSGMTAIELPDSVTSIGESAFQKCSGMTSIEIPNGVTTISVRSFVGCTSLTNIEIPDSVTSIGNYAFTTCSGLTSIDIPDSVTSIGSAAFYECSGLTSCTIGNGVTSIGNTAFKNCTGLTTCTIGSGVTSIDFNVFYKCSSLRSITSLATTAPTIDSTTFRDVKTGGTLYVPIGSSGYNVWMGTGNYYLGKYNWTKVEQ